MDSLVKIRPGRKIYVNVKGDASNASYAVLLLIHGSCAHSGQWDAQVNWIRQQEKVPLIVRYDYFGCGQSLKPKENAAKAYSASEHYADLLAVYERFCSKSKNVWVVGHSFGCSMALRLVSEKNSYVTKLVLIGPPSIEFGTSLPWIFNLPLWLLGWLQPALTNGFISRAFHPQTFANSPELIESERTISNSNPPFMFKAFYQSMIDYYSTEANQAAFATWFETVTVDVLIICGENDQIVPVEHSKQLLEKLISSHIAIVSNASHQVFQEQPDKVNALLAAYLFDSGSS